MKPYTLEIKMTFPAAASDEEINHLLTQLPPTLEKDLRYLGSLCVPEEARGHGDVEVEISVNEPEGK